MTGNSAENPWTPIELFRSTIGSLNNPWAISYKLPSSTPEYAEQLAARRRAAVAAYIELKQTVWFAMAMTGTDSASLHPNLKRVRGAADAIVMAERDCDAEISRIFEAPDSIAA